MILLRRILPFVSPALIAFFLAAIILDPIAWRQWCIAIAIVIVISIALMTHWHLLSSDFWAMLFPALGLTSGGIGLLFIANVPELQWVIAAVIVILFALYMENIFVFYFQPQKYTVLSLPNLSFFITVLAAFGLFSFGYYVDLINVIPIWMVVAFGGIFSLLFMIHVMWSYKLLRKEYVSVLCMMVLIMTQLIWVLHYWPVAFYINGLIIAVSFFLIASFVQLSLRNVLEKKMILQYVSMSIIGVSIVLATTRWLT